MVALTGSQGKTSTKDLLAQVLATAGKTVATFGSFNNELGLPLTVLRADTATEYLVLEMGARHIGDLRASCAVAPPEVSLVLNVGKAHLGEFGSQQGIAQAKGEIVEALGSDGVAVLNADDPLVAAMAARTTARVCTFGTDPSADVRVDELAVDDLGRPSFVLLHRAERATVAMGLVGEHHAGNAAAAAAVALSLGVSLDDVADALGDATATSRGRMEVHERADGVTVVDDAYNANPDSMRAALKALASIGRGRPERPHRRRPRRDARAGRVGAGRARRCWQTGGAPGHPPAARRRRAGEADPPRSLPGGVLGQRVGLRRGHRRGRRVAAPQRRPR